MDNTDGLSKKKNTSGKGEEEDKEKMSKLMQICVFHFKL